MINKEKQNANAVGATSSRPHFKEMTIKKQKGITLIALIITIIVMLILVGVTINVALNGGLFTKASQASKQMQVEAEKEELLSSVVAAIGYDGKVVLEDIELPTGWTGTNGTYTSPKGNNYTVDENGKITDAEEEKVYTFTLNQLAEGGNPTIEEDSWIYFDEEYVWNNVIKEDLTKNEKYLLTTGPMDNMFDIESTDGNFGSTFKVMPEIMAGNSVSANFGVASAIVETDNGAKFAIMIKIVVNDSIEDLIDSNPQREWEMTLEEFLEEYGDVEFRFLDASSIELSE